MRISDWSSDVCSSDLFTWSQGLDDTITAINAGAFDVSTLPEPVQITQRIVIPVKTENHRKCASYWSRATQTMLRTGYRTKVDTCGMDVEKTPERFVQLAAYFAAPHVHGEPAFGDKAAKARSEEHKSELQSLMRISSAVFCLKKKTKTTTSKSIKHIKQNNI